MFVITRRKLLIIYDKLSSFHKLGNRLVEMSRDKDIDKHQKSTYCYPELTLAVLSHKEEVP
jgi:hypothetical protein